MPGLSLGVGANVRGGGYTTGAGGAPPATTAQGAAFGTASAPAASSASLAPTTPAGVAFWIGIGAVAFLGALYWTLPA